VSGYNLPPGCSVSDIPGNRPEDQAWEELWDWLMETDLSPHEVKAAIIKAFPRGECKESSR
jgi:hypothetical protein